MTKRKGPKTYIWKLFIILFFIITIAGTISDARTTGKQLNPGGFVAIGILIIAVGYWWWRTRMIDYVLLARSADKKISRLQKVRDMRQLLEIAEKTDSPVQEEALRLIADQRVFLAAARKLDAFALEQITDSELLYTAASDKNFFRKRKNSEAYNRYQDTCLSMRKTAIDRITDPNVLLRLAGAPDTDLSADSGKRGVSSGIIPTSIHRYAGEKLLREHPEMARPLYWSQGVEERLKSIAEDTLTEQVKLQIAARPGSAFDLCRDRSLPVRARIIALDCITNRTLLRSAYTPDDNPVFRKAVTDLIQDQEALISVAEIEPDRDIRISVEKRVTDPKKRLEYCSRGEAHAWEEVDTRWELYGDYHNELITYQCRICGVRHVKMGRSFKD